jgi:L-serine/L-threonine ammonia-lyase
MRQLRLSLRCTRVSNIDRLRLFSVLVPAYDEPILWEGHASMIEETARQLPQGVKPDAVVCCVGGGGLLGGVIVGCKSVGWDDGECILLATYSSVSYMNGIKQCP